MTRGNPGRHAARHRAAPTPRPARTGGLDTGRVALIAAPLATVAVVGAGVVLTGAGHGNDGAGSQADSRLTGAAAAPQPGTGSAGNSNTATVRASTASSKAVSRSALDGGARSAAISRDLDRLDTTVAGHEWSTADLNVYTRPAERSAQLADIASGSRVAVTSTTLGAFTEIVIAKGRSAWVHSAYLAAKKPVDPATAGLVFKPCAATASVEQGLVPNAVKAWEAVCNAFPQVHTFLGLGNRPEHDTGHAIDVMVYGDTALGYKIAQFVQAHAADFDLYDLIYRQHIWTPVRASEGWRLMPDRGSPTANHMDHVHVGVN